MLTMKLLAVLAGCCLASCAVALMPSGPSYQHAAIEGPSTISETNLDDVEYQIHFKEGDTNRNLSCKTRQAFLRTEPNALMETDDIVHLKLQNYEPSTFSWLEVSNSELKINWKIIRKYRETVNDTEFNFKSGTPSEYISLDSFLISPYTRFGSVYSICRAWLANTSIIGMMSWESGSPYCQVLSRGQLMNLANYTVLTNGFPIKFTWFNVTTWRDIPRTADLFRTVLPTSSGKRFFDTEIQYIGRLLSPGLEPIIIDVPKGKEEAELPSRYSIDGVQRQALVPVGFLNYTIDFLLCKPATGAFNLSQYREEVFLEAKVEPGQGEKENKLEKTIGEATVFSKIEEKATLRWEFFRNENWPINTVFAGKDGHGDEIYVCRICCIGSWCDGYNYTAANGSIIYRSIHKILGTFSPKKRPCSILLNNGFMSTQWDWLANPRQGKVSWTPVTALSSSNGSIVTSDANGETYAIGRIFRPGTYIWQGDTLGHVDLSSKTILLSNGSIFTWENGQEKVDILMIHE